MVNEPIERFETLFAIFGMFEDLLAQSWNSMFTDGWNTIKNFDKIVQEFLNEHSIDLDDNGYVKRTSIETKKNVVINTKNEMKKIKWKKDWTYSVNNGQYNEEVVIPWAYCYVPMSPQSYEDISEKEFNNDYKRHAPSSKLIRTSIHIDKFGRLTKTSLNKIFFRFILTRRNFKNYDYKFWKETCTKTFVLDTKHNLRWSIFSFKMQSRHI